MDFFVLSKFNFILRYEKKLKKFLSQKSKSKKVKKKFKKVDQKAVGGGTWGRWTGDIDDLYTNTIAIDSLDT